MPDDPAIVELRTRLAALEKATESRFEWEEKARVQALTELERRLTNLNHAHENMVNDRTIFLRADVYDRFYQEYREWSQRTDSAIGMKVSDSEFGPWKERVDNTLANQAGRVATWGVVLLIAIAIGTILATLLRR